jgi:hypothetical protein
MHPGSGHGAVRMQAASPQVLLFHPRFSFIETLTVTRTTTAKIFYRLHLPEHVTWQT